MTGPDALEAVGYVRTDSDSFSLALPVMRAGGQKFLQVSFIESLGTYELATYLGEYTSVQAFPIDSNRLRQQRIICLIENSSEHFLWADADRDFLRQKLYESDYSATLKLQIADILNEPDARVELEDRVTAQDPSGSLANSVLRNVFFEIAMNNLQAGTVLREASVTSFRACRYLKGPTLSSIPREVLDPLLDITTVNEKDFERILKERARGLANRAEPDTYFVDFQIESAAKLIEQLRKLPRQELRISHMLRALLEEPRVAFAALKQYRPWAKAEAESIAKIERRHREIAAADDRRRSLIIAQLIPEVMRSQFGARRGRLLLDLARNLSHFPIVRDAIDNEFRRRRHTYSVQYYDGQIRESLDQGH